MATAKNGSVVKAAKKNGNNSAAIISAHLDQMEAFGVNVKNGIASKQSAIDMWINDCLAELVTVANVDQYVDRYAKGADLSSGSKGAFKSQLKAFGDANVIKAFPTFNAALNKLHLATDEKTKKAVSKAVTGKDRFGQQYKLAVAVKDLKGATPAITEKWVLENISPKAKTSAEVASAARKAIAESVEDLLPAKPTKAQLDAATQFFNTFGIELIAQLKPTKAPAKK